MPSPGNSFKELADNGCDIAAHGYFHLKVNRKLYDKDPKSFKKEIFLAKKVLEEHLKRKVSIYVYPFGLRDDLTISTLKEAGFRYAFTIDRGRLDVPLASGGDRQYELPRYMVTRTSWSYCFDRVMKNARPKVSYRVAAADDRKGNPPKRAEAPRHVPFADPYPDADEWIYSVVSNETGRVSSDNQDRAPRVKKKIGKIEKIGSDAAVDFKNGAVLSPHDGGSTIVAAGQRMEGGARREAPVFDPGVQTADAADDPASGPAMKLPDPADLTGAPGVMNAGMEKIGRGYDVKMKARFNDITRGSSRAYHVFLGRVKEKVERIKLMIRKYVVANF